MGKLVKILGPGCANCRKLEAVAREAAAGAGVDAEFVGHSEEHLMVRTPRASEYRVGDVLYGLPFHVCPTMALHSEVWAVKDGNAAELWPVTARARRLTI